jgi:N-acetylmuramic acid 6-phosphate etherase
MAHHADELGTLATERASQHTRDLDLLPVEEALYRLNDEDALVAPAVRETVPEIARAVLAAERSLRSGGRLIYAGAGTSGRLGCLDAAELPPTFGLEPGRVVALLAGGDAALRSSVEGAEDDFEAGEHDIRALGANARDTVVGIAASGRTPYVLGALAAARRCGAVTVGITTNRPTALDGAVEILIVPVVGAEPVSGSTRMKSGSAQKMVLNMLSTLTMVRLGKTCGNLMVDVRATNTKLVARAQRLIREVAGVGEEEAARLFAAAHGETKLAILMGLTGLGRSEAHSRLTAAGGVLRRALLEDTTG